MTEDGIKDLWCQTMGKSVDELHTAFARTLVAAWHAEKVGEPVGFRRFVELGQRLHGVDLQFRRSGVTWPDLWRAALYANKNERSEFRITAYGPSADAAIDALLAMYEQLKHGG